MIELRLLTDHSLLSSIGHLRTEVWREADYYRDDYFAHDFLLDSHDEHALHWGAFANGSLVAAARLCVHHCFSELPDLALFPQHFGRDRGAALPVASFNRLVVRKSAQGQGLARRFDQVRVDAARSLGVKSAVIVPVESRTLKLQALGFQVVAQAVPDPKALRPVNEHCLLMNFT